MSYRKWLLSCDVDIGYGWYGHKIFSQWNGREKRVRYNSHSEANYDRLAIHWNETRVKFFIYLKLTLVHIHLLFTSTTFLLTSSKSAHNTFRCGRKEYLYPGLKWRVNYGIFLLIKSKHKQVNWFLFISKPSLITFSTTQESINCLHFHVWVCCKNRYYQINNEKHLCWYI